ncbi:MAG: single-stranded-DNA-specific exonuclease RecJ [Alicyclobacillus sp.]|nr:single-stranded-DNA-specific exonuclease RecJ [Alicyclobacillus sp.]
MNGKGACQVSERRLAPPLPLWRTAAVPLEQAARLAAATGIPVRVARWLCTRGVDQPDAVHAWLEPQSIPWSDPYDFLDLAAAVQRVRQAVAHGERLIVVGDYDVDGVTASVILYETLSALGADVHVLLPHREQDGYGLSPALVERVRDLGGQVVVTVDNGIRAHEAVASALAAGLSVVVTDHHEPGDPLPAEVPVVHWIRARRPELSLLSGAGVAWKLAQALLDPNAGAMAPARGDLGRWLTALAALGALADAVPLTQENRRLVHAGVAALRSCTRPGWLALCQVAGLAPARVTAAQLQWSVIPRLNAAGRMDSADTAWRLLTAPDAVRAGKAAEQLEVWNEQRRQETERTLREAQAQLAADGRQQQAERGALPAVVVWGTWRLGVAGIAAARLAQTYGVPAIVLADDGQGELRGSGRAPDGWDLLGQVTACAHVLEHYGGHARAVGLGLRAEHAAAFRAAFEAACQAQPPALDHPWCADDYLPLREANTETLAWLERLAPFGAGHPPFDFYIGPVELLEIRRMGRGQHVRLRVCEGDCEAELVWFQAPEAVQDWSAGERLAAVCRLERQEWQGRVQAQLRVVRAVRLQRPLLRADLAALYRLLRARRRLTASEAAAAWQGKGHGDPVRLALAAFVELGFARRDESAYHVVDAADPRDLRESLVYQQHLREAGQQWYA